MRTKAGLALVLALSSFLCSAGYAKDGNMSGYEYDAMRTLTLPDAGDSSAMIASLQEFAREKGLQLTASSQDAGAGSVTFSIDGGKYFIDGGTTPWAPGIELSIYWRGDTADDHVLDTVVADLRQRLAPLGRVLVVSAPPGTRPRQKNTTIAPGR